MTQMTSYSPVKGHFGDLLTMQENLKLVLFKREGILSSDVYIEVRITKQN